MLEVLRGYVLLALDLRKNSNLHGESFNFGPMSKNGYTVVQLFNSIKAKLPKIRWSIKPFQKILKKLNY